MIISIDNFVKRETEGLKGAEEYSLNGSYNFKEQSNPSSSIIKMDFEGNFIGKMNDSKGVIANVSAIKGKIIEKDNYLLMSFIKIYGAFVCNVYYFLYRPFDGKDDFEGEYVGGWSLDKRFCPLEKETSNTARLVLSKL